MMKNIFFFAILLFWGFSCRKKTINEEPVEIPKFTCKDATNKISISKKWIKGTWHWSSETTFFTESPKVKTPQTEQYNETLVLEDSIISLYRNGNLLSTRQYALDLERELTNYASDTMPVLLFRYKNNQNYESCVSYKVCKDTLFLDWSVRSDLAGREVWYKK
ncbi:MAG: hypothetical protein RLZZ292_3090 [Bacteroidota bacterium]|jgi:hypothetical protein